MRKYPVLKAIVAVFLVFSLPGCLLQRKSDQELIQETLTGYFQAINEVNYEKVTSYTLNESAARAWVEEFFATKIPLATKKNTRYEYTYTLEEVKIDLSRKEVKVFVSYTFRLHGSQGLSAPQFETELVLVKRWRKWLLTVAPLAS